MARSAGTRATRAHSVAADLRERILSGSLLPGAPLREVEIESHYGVSRHTVRSALAELVSERLAAARPYSGVSVVALDIDAVVALQDLRSALESEAVRLLRLRHGSRWPGRVLGPVSSALDELVDACRLPDDWVAVERAHSAVHRAIVDAADSTRISEAYRSLDGELQVFLLHLRPRLDAEVLAADHHDYVDELRTVGPAAVREHLDRSTALMTAALSPPGAGDRRSG
ncbi:GntR family transcriptional regulator [Labedella phragmitis]|uniref:GntR family transcriptional regulator n=1 Tax=Labedella phragmitis TaxID=2498849 RepID=A0A444PUP4_9MICO|nr:GntR family transcriptional regulator [Labedella phragmitis]RWZ51583.1 GntR family transcriptional regulator [Labedella phragmitis]